MAFFLAFTALCIKNTFMHAAEGGGVEQVKMTSDTPVLVEGAAAQPPPWPERFNGER